MAPLTAASAVISVSARLLCTIFKSLDNGRDIQILAGKPPASSLHRKVKLWIAAASYLES